ncbi:MAG: methanogenesis marker 6 protein [Methanocalculus sp. MSAO_Arc1]|uniref:methanogenesis marker 6 protein n=1 Tax=Methanocalculus TaxID=71151 RepID=UPI000FF32454|nr:MULTISPECIES: methanogenesis marker 6 protein [unclassified Methanocalculus]MCP1662723.1 putative methanogenesis marker protein 6 [Methanocalculus sp. AMF5]RQD79965.1 MAG: methanogenesis marker 6 protein [Methanocalculus sp. MSAO_Arc1]
MKEYTPGYVGTVTRYVFVDSPTVTPQDLAIAAYEVAMGVMIKETCFGVMITGTADEVRRIEEMLRRLDPHHIFIKDRGFPPGDERRCRANLGGSRPGYLGHEFEMQIARFISHGLKETDTMKENDLRKAIETGKKERFLDIEELASLIDTEEA